jgi:Fe-S cluster assembly protein SufB
MVHAADETASNIVSKSISIGKGRAISWSSTFKTPEGLQEQHRVRRAADQFHQPHGRHPAITVRGTGSACQHEASVSQIGEEQIFYMMSRGLTEAQR